jgi:hypothetical protein
MLVMDAPGRNDDASGKHFMGESGKYLRRTLRGLGIDPDEDCWMTYAAICHSAEQPVSTQIVNYCKPNILQQIEKLEPRTVITFGFYATSLLVSHAWGEAISELEPWVGSLIPAQKYNAWICPNYDIRHIMKFDYKKALGNYFRHYLSRAVKTARATPFPDGVPEYKNQIELVYSSDEIIDRITDIRDGSTIAFDYECSALKPEADGAKIVSCAICVNGESTFAFPMLSSVIPYFTAVLRNRHIAKIAANMKYEDRWSRVILKTKIQNWLWDTMLAGHLLDCRPGINSLKFQAFAKLGQSRYDLGLEPYLKSKGGGGNDINRIHKIPMNILLEYNGMDALLEYILAEKQIGEFDAQLLEMQERIQIHLRMERQRASRSTEIL